MVGGSSMWIGSHPSDDGTQKSLVNLEGGREGGEKEMTLMRAQ